MYLRSWVNKVANIANSSGDLSLAISHAKIEINVTNSQYCIIEPPCDILCNIYVFDIYI